MILPQPVETRSLWESTQYAQLPWRVRWSKIYPTVFSFAPTLHLLVLGPRTERDRPPHLSSHILTKSLLQTVQSHRPPVQLFARINGWRDSCPGTYPITSIVLIPRCASVFRPPEQKKTYNVDTQPRRAEDGARSCGKKATACMIQPALHPH